MFSLRRRHLLIGVLVLLTLATNAFVAYWNIARLVRNERLVTQTFETEAQIEVIVSLAKDIETEQRGFLLTGDESYLPPLRNADDKLDAALSALESITADPQQKQNLPLLKTAVATLSATAHRAIQQRRTDGVGAAARFKGQDKQQMEAIRDLATQMHEREDELLSQRTGESSDSAQDAFRTFWIATGANIVFVSFISGMLLQASRQNRQLEHTVRDLKRAEDLRDSLSQMLVHDLRTPLTTLIAPLQMLSAETLGPLDETQKEVVEMSAQSGARLLKMVNGLLDISKLEAGEMKLHRSRFGVPALIQSACAQAKHEDDDTTAPVGVVVDPALELDADHDLIERVLINLIGNALKFTPPTGRVLIRARQLEGVVRFEVQDNGEGIPAQDIERIFDKFGQVQTRQNGTKHSTGLGLTFCKLAIEAHGGQIGVHSEVGRGSIFWFQVPA